MLREELASLIAQQPQETVDAIADLLPALTELRKGGLVSVKSFAMFYDAGLPVSLLIQTRPARREKDRVEASVISGRTAQLVLDFDVERAS